MNTMEVPEGFEKVHGRDEFSYLFEIFICLTFTTPFIRPFVNGFDFYTSLAFALSALVCCLILSFTLRSGKSFYLWRAADGCIYRSVTRNRLINFFIGIPRPTGDKITKVVFPRENRSLDQLRYEKATFEDGTDLTTYFVWNDCKPVFVTEKFLNADVFNVYKEIDSYLQKNYSSAIEVHLEVYEAGDEYFSGILSEMGISATITGHSLSYDRNTRQVIREIRQNREAEERARIARIAQEYEEKKAERELDVIFSTSDSNVGNE